MKSFMAVAVDGSSVSAMRFSLATALLPRDMGGMNVPSRIANDLTDVLKPVKKGHFAAITTEELPVFLKAMSQNDARLYMPTRIALRLMLLLFLRTSELIETPWSEINLETGEWIIPWNRMKRGKLAMNPDTTDHHVCMSRQALKLLRQLHTLTGGSKWLFPNQRYPQKPMSNGAILMAIRRMGYQRARLAEKNGWIY